MIDKNQQSGLPSYVCAACNGPIRGELSNREIPATWNDACSPECGNHMDGVLEVAPDDHPKVMQHRWNQWEWWVRRYAVADKQAACEHDWQESGGHTELTWWGEKHTEMQRFKLLKCDRCAATKSGDPLTKRIPRDEYMGMRI